MFHIQTFQETILIKPKLGFLSDPPLQGVTAAGGTNRDRATEAIRSKKKTPFPMVARRKRTLTARLMERGHTAKAHHVLEAGLKLN